jgi:hypothetical protein
VNLDVTGAVVTYVRPNLGAFDEAGFFAQQSAQGPAVFVVGEHGVEAGDVVDFTALSVGSQDGLLAVLTLEGLEVTGTTTATAQDFSADAALVSGVADRESELARVTLTLTADPTANSGGARKGAASTAGGTTPTFRHFNATAAGLRSGCIVTVESPLGRFGDEVQVTAWDLSQIVAVDQCLASVETATALDATTVQVTFDRAVDASTVAADGAGFSIAGLAVSAAVATGNIVTLTTAPQTPDTAYTVEVSTRVLDVFGSLFDEDASTATFTGFRPAQGCPAVGGGVFISEVADPVASNGRFVELFNASGAAVDLSTFSLRLYSNGSSTISQQVTLSGTIPSCGTFLVVNNAANFAGVFAGVASNQVSAGVINANGDDVFELANGGAAVDVFGVVGVDGTGQPWEFLDSIAKRNASVVSGTTTFDLSQWSIAADAPGMPTPGVR